MAEILEEMKRIHDARASSGARRAKYPESVRRAAVRYWQKQRTAGRRSSEAAADLGVHEVLLHVWRRRMSTTPRVIDREKALPVIREVVFTECAPVPMRPTFTVHGACALRIEGMSVAQLIELMRGLR